MESTKIKVPLVDFKKQYSTIKSEIDEAVKEVLESQDFILGRKVVEFENNIARYLGVKHAIGVSSCTDALLISLMALGIGKGDEVITTPFTFISTAEAIVRVGAKPVFVDIKDDYNIDEAKIESAITDKTKAIIPVHLFGKPCNMDEIKKIANDNDLFIIEDAAQAFGAEFKDKKVGTIGNLGCFSFFPAKNLGAAGDAGLVVTGDGKLATKIRALRAHGRQDKYIYGMIGGNFRLDAIQAAILDVKLKYIDEWNKKRQENGVFYSKKLTILEKTGKIRLPVIDNSCNVFSQFSIKSESRNELKDFLEQKGIKTEIYYPVPLHLQEAFIEYKYQISDMPFAEALSDNILSIPIHPYLTSEQLQYVVTSIQDFYNGKKKTC